MFSRVRFVWCSLVYLVWVSSLLAAERVPLAKLAPESTVVYAELARPAALLDAWNSPLVQQVVTKVEGVRKFYDSQQYQQLRSTMAHVEKKIGAAWDVAVRKLTSGGASLSIDVASFSGVVIIRGEDAALLEKLHATIVEIVEAEARRHDRPSPIQTEEIAGRKAWSFAPQEYHVLIGDTLAISNRADVLEQVVARLEKGGGKSLADTAEYRAARRGVPANEVAWGMARLELLRYLPQFRDALKKKSDNPVAEMLFGGVADAIRRANFAAWSIHADAKDVKVRAYLPYDVAQTSPPRRWWFPATAGQGAAAAVRPRGTIASVSAYADLAGMWAQREQLYDDAVLAGMAQADAQLGLYFSGREFGPEILGKLSPRLQFVVARQEYAADQPTPTIKLPAFALVLDLKDSKDFATTLLIAYQQAVGLGGFLSKMNGQQALLMASEEHRGVTISKATFIAESDSQRNSGKIVYNFNPSCAKVGDKFVFASTTGVTRDLIDALKDAPAAPLTADQTRIDLRGDTLSAILSDNRDALISQNMLAEGRDRATAEKEIGGLFDALRHLDHATVRLAAEANLLTLELGAAFK